MHIPSGFWKNELGDIDVIAHGDVIHVFYLSIPSHDRVGHLVSRDGLTWAEERPAIVTGDPGEFDDDQIWTMGVCERGGIFFMLYTGISRRDRGKVQRAGLATSKDLVVWTKHSRNPVACADPRWYEAAADGTHRVDWRDPKPFVENGLMHAVISARSNAGPFNRRGCAGYFVSKNGYDWEVKPPLHVPGNCYDFETPALMKLKGRYYLTGISGKDRDQAIPNVYRVADRVEGPYRRTRNDDLLPGANSVYKPCVWKGMPLYFHNLRGPADWPTGKGEVVTCLPPPKVADADADGGLVLRPFPCWDGVARGPWQEITPAMLHAAGIPALGRWESAGEVVTGDCGPGIGALLLPGEQGSVIVECELEAGDAREFGLVLRADEQADDATFVAVVPATRRVQLYTQQEFLKTPSAGVTYRWRGRRIVQEGAVPMEFGPRIRLRVVAYGPYVEVALDDRVLISAVTLARPAGRVGIFAEDGRIAVRSLRMRPLNAPAAQSMCV